MRRWQCFACGIEFSNFEEMKAHILEKHEEGREYVVCPMSWCKAPVRDIPLHIKVKHKGKQTPKGIQLRASVWRDFGPGGKKKKTSTTRYVQGSLISLKNKGKPMYYRSGYEKATYEALELMTEVTKYDVEPFPVPYVFKKKQRNYYPDIYVAFKDEHVEIWEIKPYNQKDYPQNQAKWKACNQYCQDRGWTFKVKTEKGIKELREQVDLDIE